MSLASRPVLLALSSAALFVVSFPNWNQPWCAWIAFLPWFALLRRCSATQAFWWSYAIGVAFFLASMWWLTYLTRVAGPMAWLGWAFLCAYLALFFAGFGWLTHRSRLPVSTLPQLFLLSAIWVSMEFLRTYVLSGLGWNLLAYSQTPWLEFIQIAEVTGVWGVSFVIVFVNVALASTVLPMLTEGRSGQHVQTSRSSVEPSAPCEIASDLAGLSPGNASHSTGHAGGVDWRPLALAVLGLVAVVGYGTWRIPRVAVGSPVRLALVQGNIPQEEKWDPAHTESILQRYEGLTREASQRQPQLIVWPETSTPGYVGLDEALTQRIAGLARSVKIPLVVGSPMARLVRGALRSTNSAILMDAEGVMVHRYDKLHLVPFGEFVPFERVAPWLREVLPPIGDFVPGGTYTVFHPRSGASSDDSAPSRFPGSLPRFSVLICFEDLFPNLARQFVQRGAKILVNITNDAWFGPTSAAYQHAQASTFRAVELRVPVVRAANTGWSGCIDQVGRWRERVRDVHGRELFVQGIVSCDLRAGSSQSPYLHWGDWFAGLCLVVTLIWLGTGLFVKRHTPSRRRM